MSLCRQLTSHACRGLLSRPVPRFITARPFLSRGYAKKGRGHGLTETAKLIPGSQQPITDPAAQAEYATATEKMKAAVEWFRKDCITAEQRASGRVSPAILAPVRVTLPSDPHTSYKLEQLATVGVRDGTVLLVTLFEEDAMKAVEAAIYAAKIPGVVPQRQDGRTIRIPIPRPTVETRNSVIAASQKQAEDSRVQLRKHHQASLKRGKYEKHSVELQEFQKLTDTHIKEIDSILAQMKKSLGSAK